ncbi:uncharacterized protein PV09_00978 [Verruconis gallopava]|uniref:Ketoreductase domain-containing protein n=1 Tax=Verruconis gallopava TaxID=253628 RepID=A0A0D2B9Y1_9PEZI|nr:uncharacterized protein PV09_00978 [Verruconis gallopava]KIW08034.1 hypothetical protein PV09_00978 [Verruconis gallopava]
MSQSKVIIITGASRGIGLAASQYLLSQGHKIAAVARSKEPLEKLAAQSPDQVLPLAQDLSSLTIGKDIVDATLKKWQRIDSVIINHGTLDPIKRVADMSPEEWRSAFDINVFSGVGLIQAALPSLRQSKGTIILTSSGAAVSAYSTWGTYGAAKAVLNHLALTLSVEEPDVTSVSIRPGTVDTEMQREIREKHHTSMDAHDVKKFASLKSEGKLLRPEQPGHVIAKLAVGASRELSGRFLNWNDKDLAAFQ